MTKVEQIRVPAADQVFAGHFPGQPILPGSVLLDLILARWGARWERVVRVKFQRPVLPGQTLEVHFSPGSQAALVQFHCWHQSTLVCSGLFFSKTARRVDQGRRPHGGLVESA